MTKTLVDRFSVATVLPFPCKRQLYVDGRDAVGPSFVGDDERVHIRDAVKCRPPCIRPVIDMPLVSHSSKRPPVARLTDRMVLLHSKDSQSINQSLLCLRGEH